jgi:hypothetical protein
VKRRLVAVLGTSLVSVCLAASAVAAERGVSFLRADGSSIRFAGKVSAWCGPWENGVRTQTLHVGAAAGQGARTSFWRLRAVLRDVRPGRRVSFPTNVVSRRPRGASLYVLDSADRQRGGNEASTTKAGSNGWISFTKAGCKLGDRVEFRLAAVMGSKLGDKAPITANGLFRGVVSRRPPGS